MGAIPLRAAMSSYAEEVARAVADVFLAASISHGGVICLDGGRLIKIDAYRHGTENELSEACDQMVREGMHPAISLARRRVTPIDILAIQHRPADAPKFNRFVGLAKSFGHKSVFLFPLRNMFRELFLASGARLTGLGWAEARLIHTFCLDAVAEVDAKFAQSLPAFNLLTERERSCLRATADGDTEKEIARGLNISPNTVRAHIENCKRKLRAKSKTEAVVRAMRAGLIEPAGS